MSSLRLGLVLAEHLAMALMKMYCLVSAKNEIPISVKLGSQYMIKALAYMAISNKDRVVDAITTNMD